MKPNDSTKEKILKVANDLFAKNGFAATPVRDIAEKADVNLAAINYHFQNKENLYWEVFAWNHAEINNKIEMLGQQTKTTEELTQKVFRLFVKEKSALMNTFKIFLSDNIRFPKSVLHEEGSTHFGPPGEQAFLQKIHADTKNKLSDAAAYWVVKMIFSLLVHFGVSLNTKIVESKREQGLALDFDSVELMLIHSLRAHMHYAKKHSDEIPIVSCS